MISYNTSVPQSAFVAAAPLDSILCTDELWHRPSRPADLDGDGDAVGRLLKSLDCSPRSILQALADTILKRLQCDSAGVSLVNEAESRFYWPAIAGQWQPHIAGGTPRDFGPCADVLRANVSLMFTHFEKRYPYLGAASPPASECLLVPFHVEVKAVGTIWGITHDPPDDINSCKRESHLFDCEDLRRLEALTRFASAAYKVWTREVPREERPGELPAERLPATEPPVVEHRLTHPSAQRDRGRLTPR